MSYCNLTRSLLLSKEPENSLHSYADMLLCQHCSSFDFTNSRRPSGSSLKHQPSYAALITSKNAGCDVCAFFERTLSYHTGIEGVSTFSEGLSIEFIGSPLNGFRLAGKRWDKKLTVPISVYTKPGWRLLSLTNWFTY